MRIAHTALLTIPVAGQDQAKACHAGVLGAEAFRESAVSWP